MNQSNMRSSLLRPGGVIMQSETKNDKPDIVLEKQYTVRITNFFGCKDKSEIMNLVLSKFHKKISYIYIAQNFEYCFIGVSNEDDANELSTIFNRYAFNNMILSTKILK